MRIQVASYQAVHQCPSCSTVQHSPQRRPTLGPLATPLLGRPCASLIPSLSASAGARATNGDSGSKNLDRLAVLGLGSSGLVSVRSMIDRRGCFLSAETGVVAGGKTFFFSPADFVVANGFSRFVGFNTPSSRFRLAIPGPVLRSQAMTRAVGCRAGDGDDVGRST
jgi:hypothetical protein